MAELEEFTWIFALTVIFAFGTAIGIGANDVANSFGTSVASRALTMGQVVIVASIMEFLGAVLLGAGVTSTIKSGVADLDAFVTIPQVLMYGFMAISMTTAFWDNLASQLAMPVSMTHTTVGATVGMALALRGGGAVIWSEHKDEFPYVGGMVPIFLSWVISPIMCALITVILFIPIRIFILRSEHSFMRAFYFLPILVGGMVWLIVSFIIQTGSKNGTWKERSDGFAAWVGAAAGVPCGILTVLVVMPYLKRRIDRQASERQDRIDAEAAAAVAAEAGDDKDGIEKNGGVGEDGSEGDGTPGSTTPTGGKRANESPWQRRLRATTHFISHNPVTNLLLHNVRQDIHGVAETDSHVKAVHDNAETFDAKTEDLFKYLQIFSACVMSFTHGANDVSNAMGPFSAVYQIWRDGDISSKVEIQTWILVVGGVGIAVGLTLFGWRIMQVIGMKTVKVTCVRGFCAEFATATTVAVASRYGLPVSTTMTITGGLIGLGLCESLRGINWRVLLRIFAGWVLTLFVACGVCAGITAFGAYSPFKTDADQIVTASGVLNASSNAMLAQIEAALAGLSTPNIQVSENLQALNATVVAAFAPVVKSITSIVDANEQVLSEFNTTLAYNPFTGALGSLVI